MSLLSMSSRRGTPSTSLSKESKNQFDSIYSSHFVKGLEPSDRTITSLSILIWTTVSPGCPILLLILEYSLSRIVHSNRREISPSPCLHRAWSILFRPLVFPVEFSWSGIGYSHEYLMLYDKLFHELNIPYAGIAGNLLSAVGFGGLFPWEYDTDFGMFLW